MNEDLHSWFAILFLSLIFSMFVTNGVFSCSIGTKSIKLNFAAWETSDKDTKEDWILLKVFYKWF